MSEEKEKPKKKWPFIILSLPLLIAVISCSLACDISTRKCCTPAYNSAKDETKNAVADYMSRHNGAGPTLNVTYTNANCSNCNLVNVSALLIANGGVLRDVPDGTWQGPGDMDDNCDSLGGHISGCSASNHYIWIVDANGYVYSYCVGDDCTSNNSGYQGVWP